MANSERHHGLGSCSRDAFAFTVRDLAQVVLPSVYHKLDAVSSIRPCHAIRFVYDR